MDDLLTPVSTIYKKQGQKDEEALVEISTSSRLIQPANETLQNPTQLSNAKDALEILKNQPGSEDLKSVLDFLNKDSNFSITSPGPLASQLIHVLVSEVIPNYWNIIHGGNGKAKSNRQSHNLKLILSSIRSMAGINAILLNLKRLIQQSKETKKNIGGELRNFESGRALVLTIIG